MNNTERSRVKRCYGCVALIMTAPALAYVLLQDNTLPGVLIRWHTTNIPYYINPTGSGLPDATVITEIQKAFNAWAVASDGAITFTYMGTTTATANHTDHQNTIFWDTTQSVVDKGNLAQTVPTWDNTGAIIDMDIAFAVNLGHSWQWSPTGSGCPGGPLGTLGAGVHFGGIPIVWTVGQQGISGTPFSNVYNADLRATATHEIGHLLGLAHTNVQNAVMSVMTGATPSFFCSLGQRVLQPDDIAGINALYQASPTTQVTLNFQGTVTFVYDPNNHLQGIITPQFNNDGSIHGTGTFVSGILAYNTAATPCQVNPVVYCFYSPPATLTATLSTTVGPLQFRADYAQPPFTPLVIGVLPGATMSAFAATAHGSVGTFPPQTPVLGPYTYVGIQLIGDSSFLTSTALPQTLDLSRTQDAQPNAYGNSFIDSSATGSSTGDYWSIQFRLDQLTPQP